MPYYLETDDRDLLRKLRRENVCAVCGGMLEARYDLAKHLPYLQCWYYPEHEGIAREAMPPFEPNILTRRQYMAEQHGVETSLALRRFDAIATLTKDSASEILAIIFPGADKASPAEFAKAIGLCVDYGLDPRMNDLFLIPFKVKVEDDRGKVIGEKKAYQTVRGIASTRKIAARKHHWSFLDNTPRYMTEEEEKQQYKTIDPEKIRRIVKLRDTATGAEALGAGEWSKHRSWTDAKGAVRTEPNNPKGIDKGNTMENMADYRAERKALDRLYPADMPSRRIPVIDEPFIEGEGRVLNTDTGKITEVAPDTEEMGDISFTDETPPGPEPEPISLASILADVLTCQLELPDWKGKGTLAMLVKCGADADSKTLKAAWATLTYDGKQLFADMVVEAKKTLPVK